MDKKKALDSAFFYANRLRLREIFGDTAPIVVTANGLLQKSADSSFAFRQDSNFWYLSGLNEPDLILVIDNDSEYIIRPPRDLVREKFEGSTSNSELSRLSGIEQIFESNEGWKRLGRKLKKTKHLATIKPAPAYIEQLALYANPARANLLSKIQTYNDNLDLIDLRVSLGRLRSQKTPIELLQIEDAISDTTKLFRIIDKKLDKAKYEYELHAEIVRQSILLQKEFAYAPIIANANNALTLHYEANNQVIDHSKFTLFDVGLASSGYSADVTRTIVRKPTKRQQAVYDSVLEVHDFACTQLRPGTTLKTYETAVTQHMGEKLCALGLIQTISEKTVREYYPHATSHFIGLDTHDVGERNAPLLEGMVLSVEPGIYIKEEDVGIRIEDMVLITSGGNRNLSLAIPKQIDRLS